MITTDEFARNLAKHFINAPYKEHALNHMLIEISCLRYGDSKQALRFGIKAAIVQLVEINIARDAKSLSAFQLLKPSLLQKLQKHSKNKLKEDKANAPDSSLKQFKWNNLLNYRS
jgi:hypothetical protein